MITTPEARQLADLIANLDGTEPDYPAAVALIERGKPKPPPGTHLLPRTSEWLALADLWADHVHTPWAQVARRSPGSRHHLPYVMAERPYWHLYEQIRPNHGGWLNFLMVDIDGPSPAQAMARAWACPSRPSWVTKTPHGAHAGWLIDPVHSDRPKAHRYARAVGENLRLALNGDPGYTNTGTRNPLHQAQPTEWGNLQVRGLRTIHAEIGEHWTSDVATRTEADGGDGRNTRVNRELWRWACDHPKDLDHIHATAHLLNSLESPPMDDREVDGIIRSVLSGQGKARGDGSPRFSEEQSRKGGQARAEAMRTEVHQVGAAASLTVRRSKAQTKAGHAQALAVFGLSTREIATTLGMSKSAVSRYLSQP